MEISLSPEALVRLMNTEFPQQQSVRPEPAPGTPAPTSPRSDSVIDSTTQREGSDSVTNRADEPRLVRPMELAQPLGPSFGQRFAALLPLIAGAVLAIAGVSVYVLVYPPADEKLATTTAPGLKAPPVPADAPAEAKKVATATSPERAPEFSARGSMPAPVKPPEEAPPIVTVAPAALAPGAASAVPTRDPAKPPTEGAPIAAAASGALAPGTAPAVPTPDPAKPAAEAPPIAAVAPGALTPGTAPAAPMPTPAALPAEAAPVVAVVPGAFTPDTAPAVPMPAPAKPPAKLRASTAESSALLARGDSLFGVGDVASARLFYERATDAGDAQAALRLGETFDPVFLARARLNGVRGDLAVATHWYRRARDLGASEAEILLKSIENK
jgi:hypothetical protein